MNYIKVLGSNGSKGKDLGTTCFQVYKDILIDAGNILNSLGNDSSKINHIFLTHSHSDHILDLPFVIESFFEQRETPLTIYGSKETLDSLKKHTFNDEIWPDFSKIKLTNKNEFSLIFKEILIEEKIKIAEYEIYAINANHIPGSYGYVVIKDNQDGYCISGDTYENPELWDILNKNKKIKSLIIECSFPNSMEKLASISKHLTPNLLKKGLINLKRDDLQVFLYHLKPSFYDDLIKEINDSTILLNKGKILKEGDVIQIRTGIVESYKINNTRFERIIEINKELSSQLDKNRLFEMILKFTREITHCEAGTLYIMSKDKKYLEFKVIQNDKLNLEMGGTKENLKWEALPLYLENGCENKNMLAVISALEKRIINIKDAYNCNKYEFEGTKKVDSITGYKSQSMLVVPLINHEEDVIGVLQLINKIKISKKVIPFNKEDENITIALASQAAMALTNSQLINSLEDFLNAYVSTIAQAIDAKSKHTSNHIGKMAKISILLAHAINDDKTIYTDVKYDENMYKQIELAAWMHDIGKISTPESVIDKATKLEAIVDRIDIINHKFEILKRDLEISYLKNEIDKNSYEEALSKLDKENDFLKFVNLGSEFMDDKCIERILSISKYSYSFQGEEKPLLSDNEIENLTIRKGTLTSREKRIMNNHAQLSYDMLSKLPFPKKYNKILNIAANHHEKLNGKGYPRGLSEKDLSLEDRILILSDIFEALTSNDRPYKEGKKLSEVFNILFNMANSNEIDLKLLDFFYNHDILKKYIKEELNSNQIDIEELKK